MTEAWHYWLAVVIVTALIGWLVWYGWLAGPRKGRHRAPRQPLNRKGTR